jgi:N-hydroxyarylamine O-acetyltransferase
VPFENLNIPCRKPISLRSSDLFQKIVTEKRGGYCYELNSLFSYLLTDIGFTCRMISASVYTTDKLWGPAFDHLSLIVHCDGKDWLVDAGFGDLFVKPLELTVDTIQTDGRNFFKIGYEKEQDLYCVLMSGNGTSSFENKYKFSTIARSIDQFMEMNRHKQVHPDSYFVKNVICTLPTPSGRVTVFNDRLIITKHSVKTEQKIVNSRVLEEILKRYYNIDIIIDFI